MKKENDMIPNVVFKVRTLGEWEDVTSDDLFKGKRVVLFALPGAFTPTCSAFHLPGYVYNEEKIKNHNIDAIYCLSVNDSFVMNAWGKSHKIGLKVTLIPDGNCEFTDKLGATVDDTHLGFGNRSLRYSMVVNDSVIEKMFAEDKNDSDDPFKISDATTMLNYLEEHDKK